ncbi:MAG: hypothetical protein M0Z60_10075 [Nitrospiraceae bacterium]|nr:hypothetical protein [Nitrospiraceae bacterium]
MSRKKIVVRYADGRLVRGYADNFPLDGALFHVRQLDPALAGRSVKVSLKELKAVFFVRDFSGNPAYREKKHFAAHQQPEGRRVEVTFVDDGEVLVGSTPGHEPGEPGFFVTPADPHSNNEKVFVISSSISRFRYI